MRGGQIVVGVFKIPKIISKDIAPGHIRPKHIGVLFGGVNTPPACHAEDVEDTGEPIDPVPPAAVKPHILGREPPAGAGLRRRHRTAYTGFKIARHGDQDVDRNDCKREHLEPFLPMLHLYLSIIKPMHPAVAA